MMPNAAMRNTAPPAAPPAAAETLTPLLRVDAEVAVEIDGEVLVAVVG